MERAEDFSGAVFFPSHPAIQSFLSFANSPEAERYCDVTILAEGGQRFHCHRLLLGSHSPHLHRLLSSFGSAGTLEQEFFVTLAEVKAETVEAALNFMYKGTVENVSALMEASKIFGLHPKIKVEERESTPWPNLKRYDTKKKSRLIDASSSKRSSGRKRTKNKKFGDDYDDVPTIEAFGPGSNDDNSAEDNAGEAFTFSLNEDEYSCCETDFHTRADLESHQKSFGCIQRYTVVKIEPLPSQPIPADDAAGEECDEGGEMSKPSPSKKVRRIARQTQNRRKMNRESLKCCDTEFDNELIYTSHKEVGHEEKPEGDKFMICCNEKIFGTLKVHMQSSHKLDDATEQSKCCDHTFEGINDLTKHCASTHGLRLSQYKRMICCATTLSNFEEWVQHKEQTEHIECNYCAFLSKDERHLSLHLFSKHKIGKPEKDALKCKHCEKDDFKNISERQEHEDRHDDSVKYSCLSCNKGFKLMSSLKTHMYRLGKTHNPEAKEYTCDVCKKVFKTIIGRRKHYRVEHQKKDTSDCTYCDLTFLDKGRLDQHTKVVHMKVKDVQCTSCGKLFATHERMKIHEKFVHIVEDAKVPCDICLKEFSNKDRMTDHRRSVHRDRKYQCDSCGSTFKNSSTLKSHVVSIHTTHDKKPLQCGVCGKGFLHESRLKAHELIHSDETRFSCQFCGRPNKCKNNNLKHEKRCKKAVKEGNGPQQQQQPDVTSETATILVNPSIVVTKPPPAGSIVIAARSPASVAVTSTVMANDDERDRTVSAAIQQVDEDAEVKNEIIIST